MVEHWSHRYFHTRTFFGRPIARIEILPNPRRWGRGASCHESYGLYGFWLTYENVCMLSIIFMKNFGFRRARLPVAPTAVEAVENSAWSSWIINIVAASRAERKVVCEYGVARENNMTRTRKKCIARNFWPAWSRASSRFNYSLLSDRICICAGFEIPPHARPNHVHPYTLPCITWIARMIISGARVP